jgi:hypothetical protein
MISSEDDENLNHSNERGIDDPECKVRGGENGP